MALNTNYLTFVQTGAVQYPKIHKRVLQLTTPSLVLRGLLTEVPITEGNTISFTKQIGTNAMGISKVGEMGPAPMDFTNYDYVTVTAYKRKATIEIAQEVVDDVSQFNVVEDQMHRLSNRWAMQFEADIFNCIRGAVPNAHKFDATGKSNGVAGEITIAGTIGIKDLNKARRLILQKHQVMTDIVVDPIAEEGLRNLPMFTPVTMNDQFFNQGVIGKLGSWNIRVSTLIPAGYAYCISTGQSLNGEYNPLGFLAVKQPLTTGMTIDTDNDLVKPSMRARYSPIVTNGNCLVEIAGLATS